MSDLSDRANMYFVTVTILPQTGGIDLPRFIQDISDIFSNLSNVKNILYQFKVYGEPQVIFVVNVSNTAGFEQTFATLWKQGAVQIECQPVISYEHFARSIQVSGDVTKPSTKRLAEDGLYWLSFNVDYHGKTTDKLVKIWRKEAEAVFAARRKGLSIELYKCVAERKVHAFMNVSTPGYLDALSLQLPLIVENGANVQLRCKAMQFLESYTSFMASQIHRSTHP